MNLIDKYIFKQLCYNSLLILLLIISLFCLAKSVQLVELMIGRGLPFYIFIKLISLSLPKIIPVILPVIVCLSTYFVFSRMQTDREIVILQSSSYTILDIVKPTVIFSSVLCIISFYFTLYLAPQSNTDFKKLFYTLKNDYSSTLLQEGTFNTIGKNFTIFVKERKVDGRYNVFIHDTRNNKQTSTLIAKKGKIISGDSSTKIMLEDGSQQFQSHDKKLSVLYFDKYLLDINQNQSDNWSTRWKSPSERTINELKNPNPSSLDDQNNIQAFKAELTLRYSMPLNIIGFSSLIAIVLLSFNYRRTESLNRTVIIFISIILLQVVSITASNLSIKYMNMQLLNFFPSILTTSIPPLLIFIISPLKILPEILNCFSTLYPYNNSK